MNINYKMKDQFTSMNLKRSSHLRADLTTPKSIHFTEFEK